jgi:hypothetical protein
MSILENAPAFSSPASQFDFEAETALLSSYDLEPLYFPKKRKIITRTETIFNTELLAFEENTGTGDDYEDRCGMCYEIKPERYIGCCKSNYCRACIEGCLKHNHPTCPNCRNKNYLPEPRKIQKTTTIIKKIELTDDMIHKYRLEQEVLKKIADNKAYYLQHIDGKEYGELDLSQRTYLNILQLLSTDILEDEGGDDDNETARRFYIDEPLNPNNETSEDLIICKNSYELVYRAEQSYKRFLIACQTEEGLVDMLTDSLADGPLYFPRDFIYDYCLKDSFFNALTGINDPIFEAIYEEQNEDFLKLIMKDDLKDILKHNYKEISYDYMKDIVGYDGYEETFLFYLDKDGNKRKRENIFLMYREYEVSGL